MPGEATYPSPLVIARVAGLLYLVIIVFGIGSEVFVRMPVLVADDAAATARNILSSQGLMRLGFAADSVMALCDAGLAVLLFLLLRPVSPALALVAMVFRLVQSAIIGMNLLNQHMALLLLAGPGYGAALEPAERDALALHYMVAHGHGYDLGLIFFGVCSIVTGYLVYRSGFLPRFLGAMLVAAGLVYMTGSYLRFLAPAHVDRFEALYVVPLVAELGICLWLLVRGIDVGRWREARAGTGAAG